MRKLAAVAVFLAGLGLTAGFYAVVTDPSLRETLAYRYFCGHPIEKWTTWLFFWGMAALVWKSLRLLAERGVLAQPMLAFQPGRVTVAAEVPKLLHSLDLLPGRKRDTWLVRRLMDAIAHIQHRGSAEGLEERLELLSDRDAGELEGSYELVRTVTWAIPILGFLGTVVGITIAIANITPDQLQDSLSEVVGGLAVAFDTTALALALSMVIVLTKFLVERAERAALLRVDTAIEDALLHRFQKYAPETQAFLGALEGVANVVLQATRDAWREQGQLWTRTIEQVGESQVAALHKAAQQFIEHSGRLAVEQESQSQQFLAALESLRQVCHKSLADVAAKMNAHQAAVKRQVELIGQLVADEGRLSKFQQTLSSNLATIANVQSLDEAIHSLSAAVHLLTARAGRVGSGGRLSVSGDSTPREVAA